MNSRDFCFWLQGFFELTDSGNALSANQVEMIKRHLNLVFIHDIDPSMGNEAHQGKLNWVHNPQAQTATHVPFF